MAVLRSIRQLEALADEWNALADTHGHALLRHEWFLSAACMLHDESSLMIFTHRDEHGRLVGVAPLVTAHDGGLARLEVLGASALHEPTGFLSADSASREALLQEVFDSRRPVLLRRVVASSLPPAGPGRSFDRQGITMSRPGTPCLGIDFDSGADTFFAGLPGKLRYDLRRAQSRAAAVGPTVFDAIAPGRAEVDALFAEFTSVESSGWKGRQGSALAAKPPLRGFFRSYCERTADAGTLRIFRVRIGDRVAAMQIAVELYHRLWVLKIGYDESLARCSPGLLLTMFAVRSALERQLESYEFLGSIEPWEERWRPQLREHRRVLFYPWSVTGCLGVSMDVLGASWRRMRPGTSRGWLHS